MDGIRKIARAYFDRASKEEKKSMTEFFNSLDVDGDGKVSLLDIKASVTSGLCDENLFEQLDANRDGILDFDEALVVYYLVKKVRIPRCNACRDLLVGPYFSCALCLENLPLNTCDLCCDCFQRGKFKHQHPASNFLDHHALLMMFRDRAADAQKNQRKQQMEELLEIAKAHYGAGSKQVQALAQKFFKALDTDGDGMVDLPNFLAFMRQEGHVEMRSPHFFKELDRDGNNTLDFWEVMTLYYIIKSGRPFCDWCGNFIPGIYFSCIECFASSKFNLCHDCYKSTKCNHNHNGKTQFLDNYTMLEALKTSVFAQATGLNQSEPSTSVGSPVLPNAIVPASNNTSQVPNSSNAIIPASNLQKWTLALRALEVGLAIGSISMTLCTIL